MCTILIFCACFNPFDIFQSPFMASSFSCSGFFYTRRYSQLLIVNILEAMNFRLFLLLMPKTEAKRIFHKGNLRFERLGSCSLTVLKPNCETPDENYMNIIQWFLWLFKICGALTLSKRLFIYFGTLLLFSSFWRKTAKSRFCLIFFALPSHYFRLCQIKPTKINSDWLWTAMRVRLLWIRKLLCINLLSRIKNLKKNFKKKVHKIKTTRYP